MASQKSGARKPGAGRQARLVHPRDEVRLTRKNWTIFGAAFACIVAGFISLAMGSITLAPLLLVAGYCVLIPWAILARG